MTTRKRVLRRVAPVGLAALAIACASAPKPVLYPNAHLEEVGQAVAARDIEECRAAADAAGAHRDTDKAASVATSAVKGGAIGGAAGAAGGAVAGNAGRGAGIGAASAAAGSAVGAMFRKPGISQAHKSFVDRCLSERGYEPIGWN